MRVFETYSKRTKKREAAGKVDVYQYDNLPDTFRVQVAHIWMRLLGPYYFTDRWRTAPRSNHVWREIHDTMARELGVFQLVPRLEENPAAQCVEYLRVASAEGALDLIEVSFSMLGLHCPVTDGNDVWRDEPQTGIDELNYRFREHGIGYQFESGQLMRTDSQFLHAETLVPAISLLHDARFGGAQEEFLKGHDHYRQGRNKEAIVEALKVFESCMKAICDQRKWSYASGATAKDLITIIFQNGLIPAELQSEFTALRSVLESGVPTVRNKTSGHGQGAQPLVVPAYLAGYALHTTGANIVLLVEAHNAKK